MQPEALRIQFTVHLNVTLFKSYNDVSVEFSISA